MRASKIPSSHAHRLLVEGSIDQHVVLHLLRRHGVDWDHPMGWEPFVHPAGGVESLLEQAKLGLDNHARMGVVVDADAGVRGRWNELRRCFAAKGVAVPEEPPPDGWVGPGLDGRRVGAWIMPDNQLPGMLEDFLHRLVPPEDPCWAYAGEAAARAHDLGAPFRNPIDLSKARLHTWLAWRPSPGDPPGVAMMKKYFLHDTPEALAFVAWFRRLFEEP